MPHGVHVFERLAEKRVPSTYVRDVLGISDNRLFRLRVGDVLFTEDELDVLLAAMRRDYGLGRKRLLDSKYLSLPHGRRRRAKGVKAAQRTETAA